MPTYLQNNWFYIFALTCAGLLLLMDPIPQSSMYHHFADQRTCFSIPHFHNVWTNIPFVAIGVWGLFSTRLSSYPPLLRQISQILFIGFVLTGLGSGYYHLDPHNATLLWDRLPMTIIFISFFSLIFTQAYGLEKGKPIFYFGLPIGILSVIYWYVTEKAGSGDLRPYVFTQFFPMLALPIILVSGKRKLQNMRLIIIILLCYVIAKVFEHFDHEIMHALSYSGHALKHLAAALAMYFMYRYIGKSTYKAS
ncbi:ceramidase domain-containing protein [Cytophagaceae bacterium ABcell3]|nr:ceramidase domain-containing protein [Cytophagaceae bacterium ABcell3]